MKSKYISIFGGYLESFTRKQAESLLESLPMTGLSGEMQPAYKQKGRFNVLILKYEPPRPACHRLLRIADAKDYEIYTGKRMKR